MKKPPTIQQAAIKAATVAFAAESKSGEFTAMKCGKVAKAALSNIVDKEGKNVAFTPEEEEAFLSAFYPTVPNRVAVLKHVLRSKGIEPDEPLVGLLKDFFNPAAIEKKIKAAKEAPSLTVKDLIAAAAREDDGNIEAEVIG